MVSSAPTCLVFFCVLKCFFSLFTRSQRQIGEDIRSVFREADAVRWDDSEGRRAWPHRVQGKCEAAHNDAVRSRPVVFWLWFVFLWLISTFLLSLASRPSWTAGTSTKWKRSVSLVVAVVTASLLSVENCYASASSVQLNYFPIKIPCINDKFTRYLT